MNPVLKNECYLLSLDGYDKKDIAKKLNVSEKTISRAMDSITKGNDYQLAVKGCSTMLQEFVRYQDFCRKQLKELSELKVELSPVYKIVLIKAQNEIYKDLLTLGAQGEFIQAVGKIREQIGKLERKE